MPTRRGSFAIGFLLVVTGLVLLFREIYRPVFDAWLGWLTWPWWIIGVGAVFLVFAVLGAGSGLAVPGSILVTVGLILFYQVRTSDWDSWAYVWALIPASVGLGLILSGLLDRNRGASVTGAWMLASNLVLFGIFYAAFGQGTEPFARYWPVLLVLVGIVILVLNIIPRRS